MEKENLKQNLNQDVKKEQVSSPKSYKYLDTKEFIRQHIKSEQLRRRTEELLDNPSPIVEFKKIQGRNDVMCKLQDGTAHVVPVDHTLQLYFDKIEQHPDINVDFGKSRKNRVEVLPYQNKVVYIDGNTNQVIRSVAIDSNLTFEQTDAITNSHVSFDSRLNPAILALLQTDPAAQKSYINATDKIEILYNFEKKSKNPIENISNKGLANKMNKYYKSEQEYIQDIESKNGISKKVGYAGMIDKIQSSFLQNNKLEKLNEANTNEVAITFDDVKRSFATNNDNFIDSLNSINYSKSIEPQTRTTSPKKYNVLER